MVYEFHGIHVAGPGSAATLVAPRPIGPLIRLTFAGQKGKDLRYVVFLSFFHNRAFYPAGHTSKLSWTFFTGVHPKERSTAG